MNRKNIIAVVFDFDDTLGPDSTSALLESLRVEVPSFWESVEDMYLEQWDPVLAYLYKMIELSKSSPSDKKITQELLQEWGKKLTLYNGVEDIFSHLREIVSNASSQIELEFYIISSGLEEVLRSSVISHNFKDIWGCGFNYDAKGAISFPKRIVNFTDKTRYLYQITKGLIGTEFRQKPFEVNRKFSASEIRIPFDQMIFVGDGFNDIPCFSLLGKEGGVPLAVCDPESRKTWGKAWGFMEDKRVTHWAMANYQKGSTLHGSLCMAVEALVKRIEIQSHFYQG